MCFNDYRRTSPHDGYQIIRRWKDKWFSAPTSATAQKIAKNLQKQRERHEADTLVFRLEKELTLGDTDAAAKQDDLRDSFQCVNKGLPVAGAFFIYTSNVSMNPATGPPNLLPRWIDIIKRPASVSMKYMKSMGISNPSTLRTSHHIPPSNTEIWQCSKNCTKYLWEAPTDWTFEIVRETMRAPSSLTDASSVDYKNNNGFIDNHPRCVRCGALARPRYPLVARWAALTCSI